MNEMRVLDTSGNRLYLTADERRAFLAAARQARPEVRTHLDADRQASALRVLWLRLVFGRPVILVRLTAASSPLWAMAGHVT